MGTILFFVLFFEINRIFLDLKIWRSRFLKHKDFSCPLCLDLGQRVCFWLSKGAKRGGGEGKEHLPCCSYQVGIVL